jgi:hypothetical protein
MKKYAAPLSSILVAPSGGAATIFRSVRPGNPDSVVDSKTFGLDLDGVQHARS